MPKLPGVNHLDAVRALEKAGFRYLSSDSGLVILFFPHFMLPV